MTDGQPCQPAYLHSAFCNIAVVEGKGRCLFASKGIPSQTVIETSPVLLFDAKEYEEHGKDALQDYHTFPWPDGRKALTLGLGSLFNHSHNPNVSFSIDLISEVIRFTAARRIRPGEELCVFYDHNMWFIPNGEFIGSRREFQEPLSENATSLSIVNSRNPFSKGDRNEIVAEADLPFVRTRVTPDDESEDQEGSVRTKKAWVVDIVEPKRTTELLSWTKKAGLETPDLAHLKRIRRAAGRSTLLLASSALPPPIPTEFDLPSPYCINVPESAALTPDSLKLKLLIWPTAYAPKRKGWAEPWSRAKSAWAWEAVEVIKREAEQATKSGELPIVSYVPTPCQEQVDRAHENDQPDFLAHDTRQSTGNPLRHSVLNVIRKIANARITSTTTCSSVQSSTPISTSSRSPGQSSPSTPQLFDALDNQKTNGSHYILTSLTLFTTHEPCIMCSMALLHSRVCEVVFVRPMDATGGCGGSEGIGTCVPRLKGVNHRYNIMRWKLDKGDREWLGVMSLPGDLDA